MTKILKMLSLGATTAALVLSAAPAAAQSASSQASVTINKPLTLTKKNDLAFGTVLLTGTGTFSTTVSVSATGTRTCDASLATCSGTAQQAVYNVSGNKQRTVALTIPTSVELTSTTAPADKLTMTVINPNATNTIVLTNSGNPGTDFGIGGSLTLTNDTSDGVYNGTFSVTANYQ